MASRLSKTPTHPQQPARPSQPAPVPLPPRRLSAAGSVLPLGAVRPECRGLARADVRLDGPAVDALLTEVMREHGPVTAWEEVIAPTLHAVGRKWGTTGERYVEVEHLLSWHVSTALRKAATTSPHNIEGGPSSSPARPPNSTLLPWKHSPQPWPNTAGRCACSARRYPRTPSTRRCAASDPPPLSYGPNPSPPQTCLWSDGLRQQGYAASPPSARQTARPEPGPNPPRTRRSAAVVGAPTGWSGRGRSLSDGDAVHQPGALRRARGLRVQQLVTGVPL